MPNMSAVHGNIAMTFFICFAAMVSYAIIAAAVARGSINAARREDAAGYDRHSLEIDIFAYFKGMLWPAGAVGLMETATVFLGTKAISGVVAAVARLVRRPTVVVAMPQATVAASIETVRAELDAEFCAHEAALYAAECTAELTAGVPVQTPRNARPAVMEIDEFVEEPTLAQPAEMELPELDEEPVVPVRKPRVRKPAAPKKPRAKAKAE